jgi:hypothetical protein
MFIPSAFPRADGWLHFRDPLTPQSQVRRAASKPIEPWCDWPRLADLYRTSANGQLTKSAASLGVSLASLEALRAGWDGEAITAPMYDAAKRVAGIRRRFPNGEKKSVHGGHEGVFAAWPLRDDALYVVEGFTDCAAMLSIGLNAIGRPTCSGGTKILAAICALRVVVIVADADTPGLRGATALMRVLVPLCTSVDVMEPPNGCKDVREAINKGAARKDFEI